MQIKIYNTYKGLSENAANKVIELMSSSSNPLLCAASGDTPLGLYKVLTENYLTKRTDFSSWNFIGLDEWMGMNGSDEGSCRYYIDRDLFYPLHVDENKIMFFDGRTTNPLAECETAENFVKEHNGIDVAILGLGVNGHIGMNEPDCDVAQRSHVVQLHPTTKQVGQKYFKQQRELNEGITLGMATLLESKHIILLASGEHKATIVKKVIEGAITSEVPGSLLRNHSSFTVYLDAGAASLLER